jgi:hypothetical protein
MRAPIMSAVSVGFSTICGLPNRTIVDQVENNIFRNKMGVERIKKNK